MKEEHRKFGRQKIAALIACLAEAIMAVAALSGRIVRHLAISQTGVLTGDGSQPPCCSFFWQSAAGDCIAGVMGIQKLREVSMLRNRRRFGSPYKHLRVCRQFLDVPFTGRKAMSDDFRLQDRALQSRDAVELLSDK